MRINSAKKMALFVVLPGLYLFCLLFLISLYPSPSRQAAVPEELRAKAEVIGFPGVRHTLESESLILLDLFESEVGIEGTGKQGLSLMGTEKYQPVNMLALSSGSDGGAYGAGFLSGWTVAGNRPQFDVVSGVSTGALIAPFAFLGSEYDGTLETVYTNSYSGKIFAWRNIVASLFDDAVADTSPLRDTIDRYITRELLNKIADQYKNGRLLVVTTTNLDSRRTVVWNMTKIASFAAGGNRTALGLFRKVLLASASIPGVFPPVMFTVEAGGKRYEEMHADGGIITQMFVYPPWLVESGISELSDIVRERRLYLIRNARHEPRAMDVSRKTVDILARAMRILIFSRGVTDLYRIYLTAKQHGVEYNLAYVPESFDAHHDGYFDQEYMRRLYAFGFNEAKNGYRWHKHPWLHGAMPSDGVVDDRVERP